MELVNVTAGTETATGGGGGTLATVSGATNSSLGTSSAPLSGGTITIDSAKYVNAVVEFSTTNAPATINLTPNPFTIDQIGQEGNIYLIERAATTRTVNLDTRMALVNTTSNLTPPVISTTTANTSNIAIDIIKYRILRSDYAIFSSSNLHKPPLLVPPQFLTTSGSLASVTIGNSNATLPSYTNLTGGTVSYAITSNPYNNATISGSSIVISGYYRGGKGPYNVLTTANNFVGASIPYNLTVTEIDGRPVFAANATAPALTNNQYLVNLSTLFTKGVTNEPLSFNVVQDPKVNTTLTGSNLYIQADYRNTTYAIKVSCSNKYDTAATNSTITVTESDGTPYPATPAASYTLRLDSKVYTFASLFNNPSGEAMTFEVTQNPYPQSTIVTSSQITIQGTLRAMAYTIKVRAQNRFGTSAEAVVTITELSGVPSLAIGSPTINNVTNVVDEAQYTLANLFTNNSGAALTYTVLTNTHPYTITNGVLKVTGDYRNKTWSITLTASAAGYVGSSPTATVYIQENSPMPTLLFTSKSYSNLGVNNTPLDLTTIFSNPPNTGSLVYSKTDVENSATIVGNQLSHTADYRNKSYTITITAKNNYTTFTSAVFTMNISELSGIPVATSTYTIGNTSPLSTNSGTVSLSSLFTNVSGATMTYTVQGTPSYSTYVMPSVGSDTLTVTGNNRGITWTISILATNKYGTSSAAIVSIKELGVPNPIDTPILIPGPGNVLYYYQNYSINLASLFYYPTGYPLTFAMSDMKYPGQVYLTGSSYDTMLNMTGLARNESWPLTIKATNSFGTSSSLIININENIVYTGEDSYSMGSYSLSQNGGSVRIGSHNGGSAVVSKFNYVLNTVYGNNAGIYNGSEQITPHISTVTTTNGFAYGFNDYSFTATSAGTVMIKITGIEYVAPGTTPGRALSMYLYWTINL